MTARAQTPDLHVLDQATRAALLGPHARFAERQGRVLRYPPEVSPFLAFPEDPDDADWRDLVELAGLAVCTEAEHRGQGLATRLDLAVAAGIRDRGEIPFLHASATNVNAIRLYEKLGFRRRRTSTFGAVRIPESDVDINAVA